MTTRCLCLSLVFLATSVHLHAGEPPMDLYAKAQKAFVAGQLKEAQDYIDQAVQKDPKYLQAHQLGARIQEARGKYADAAAHLSRVLELDPKQIDVYHNRGCVRFKMGQAKESVADFDKFIELRPDQKVSHWQRGISHYYAGMYDEGRQQFEGYQTYDSNDVENAVWRFMCMTRAVGMDKARKDMLKIGNDKRVPMRNVYDLYIGKVEPDDVMKAARADDPAPVKLNQQLFYAHLYVGIYHDLKGDKRKALEHLQAATEDHRIGHYMWDVARVHRDLLRKELDKKQSE